MNERISREELAKLYNVELHFFDELESSGLINTHLEDEVHYLLYEELPLFERFANWHYDLEVNLPGLEVIDSLLKKIETLQKENKKYRHLKFLQESGFIEDADF